jgi:hypothetical protein
MDKATEYSQRAEACRELARSHSGEQYDLLMSLAAQWDTMARQSEDLRGGPRDLNADVEQPGRDPTSE